MRHIYPEQGGTDALLPVDNNVATKQDIQDLSNQITQVVNDLGNLQTALDDYKDSNEQNIQTELLNAVNAAITALNAVDANILRLSAGDITANKITGLARLVSEIANFTTTTTSNLSATSASISDLNATAASIGTLTATTAQIENWNVDDLTVDTFQANTSNITTENVSTLNADEVNADEVNAGAANIDSADIDEADISEIHNDTIHTQNITHDESYLEVTMDDIPDGHYYIVVPYFKNGRYRMISQNLNNETPQWSVTIDNEINFLDVTYETIDRPGIQAIATKDGQMMIIGKATEPMKIYWVNDSLEKELAPTVYNTYDTTGWKLVPLENVKGRFILTVTTGGGTTVTGWTYRSTVNNVSDLDITTADFGDVYSIINPGFTTSDFIIGAGYRTVAGSNVVKVEIVTVDPVTGEYIYQSKWDLIGGAAVLDVSETNPDEYVFTTHDNKDKLITVPQIELDDGSVPISSGLPMRRVANATTLVSWNGSADNNGTKVYPLTKLGDVDHGTWDAGSVKTDDKVEAATRMVQRPNFYAGPELAATGQHTAPIDDNILKIQKALGYRYYKDVYPTSPIPSYTPAAGTTVTNIPLSILNPPETGTFIKYRWYQTDIVAHTMELFALYMKSGEDRPYKVLNISVNGVVIADTYTRFGTVVIEDADDITMTNYTRAAVDVDGLDEYNDGALLIEEEE